MTTISGPVVPLHHYKRTKIIATVGPSTDTYEAIEKLIMAGVNGLRLNFSHGTLEERLRQITWIRKAAAKAGKPVAIIQDLQGPKIRLGEFEGIINVQKGRTMSFAFKADYEQTGQIPLQYDLSKKVKRGERLWLYDGKVKTTVTTVKDGVVYVQAENDGVLIARKGINLPDTDFEGDIITNKDRKDIVFGSEQDIDYVALSFVQSAEDIIQLKRLLKNVGSSAKIIAKIETKAAINNMESIISVADAIMIARGDLAVETPFESVPIEQRRLISLGLRYAKPTIVATQMLASMNEVMEPTRAEVSDIATAVLLGADSLMLSDETASGLYPIQAVKVMKKVILYTEKNMPLKAKDEYMVNTSMQGAISSSVIRLAKGVQAKAIVAETKSGATALNIASLRPDIPLIAVTNDQRTAQQLSIVYGAKSYVRPADKMAAVKLTDWLRENKILSRGDIVVSASGRHPGVVGTTDTIKVRMLE